jgi:clavulanate-9-aldehyde reducatase
MRSAPGHCPQSPGMLPSLNPPEPSDRPPLPGRTRGHSQEAPVPRRGARKVVLITGASSGIGEAVALACARAGHAVVLVARRVDRLEAVARLIDRPDDVLVLPTDLADPVSLRETVALAEQHFGRIDSLVANAGVAGAGPFLTGSDAAMLEPVTINLVAVMLCARAVLPGMIARGGGHILTVSSVAGEIPAPGAAAYAASKAGVTAFSEALRREVAPHQVRVTAILPGFIRTAMTHDLPFPMAPPSVVGDLVVRLLRRPRSRAVIPRGYGALIWLQRCLPGVIDLLVRQAHRRLKAGGAAPVDPDGGN